MRLQEITIPTGLYFGKKMTKPQLYKREITRNYSAHHTFLEIASIQMELAQQKKTGWFNEALISMTFSALAVEALANAVGDRLWQGHDWEDFEDCKPIIKLERIAKKLAIPYQIRNDPWKTIQWLIKFRNKIAHAKPEPIKQFSKVGHAKKGIHDINCPESVLENLVSKNTAKHLLKSVKDLKDIFCKYIPEDELDGICTDGWSANTEPIFDM